MYFPLSLGVLPARWPYQVASISLGCMPDQTAAGHASCPAPPSSPSPRTPPPTSLFGECSKRHLQM